MRVQHRPPFLPDLPNFLVSERIDAQAWHHSLLALLVLYIIPFDAHLSVHVFAARIPTVRRCSEPRDTIDCWRGFDASLSLW